MKPDCGLDMNVVQRSYNVYNHISEKCVEVLFVFRWFSSYIQFYISIYSLESACFAGLINLLHEKLMLILVTHALRCSNARCFCFSTKFLGMMVGSLNKLSC